MSMSNIKTKNSNNYNNNYNNENGDQNNLQNPQNPQNLQIKIPNQLMTNQNEDLKHTDINTGIEPRIVINQIILNLIQRM